MAVRRFGKRNAYIAGGAVGAVGQLITFLAPNAWVAFGGSLIGMPGIMFVSMLIWALEADTVEYGEWRTGVRSEGITYAVFSFTRKAGQAIGGALAAYALRRGARSRGARLPRGRDHGVLPADGQASCRDRRRDRAAPR
jgi:glucuronide carrier protein